MDAKWLSKTSWIVFAVSLATQPASAVLLSSLSTSARTNVVWNSVTQDSDLDITAPTGDVASSASGSNFDGSARAFVNAADYGKLKLSVSASMSQTANFSGSQTDARSRIVIRDDWLFLNNNLFQQVGIATASLLIAGSWAIPDAPGQVNSLVEVGILSSSAFSSLFRNSGVLTSFEEVCNDGVTQTPCFGRFTFAIPFVFGSQETVQYIADFRAAVVPGAGTGAAWADFSNSIYWGGISSVTVGGQVVPYELQSGSGYDWRQSSIPTNGTAPEPGTFALLGLGIAGLAASRRRKQ